MAWNTGGSVGRVARGKRMFVMIANARQRTGVAELVLAMLVAFGSPADICSLHKTQIAIKHQFSI